MTEFENKLSAIRAFLESHDLEALLLRRVSSFAWVTCGAASYVNTATSEGTATLIITPTGMHLLTDNIEATRLEQEEHLKEQGWHFHVTPWHASQSMISELTKGLKWGADVALPQAVNLEREIAHLRSLLTPPEGERFVELGKLCAGAMYQATQSVYPGQSEHEIAAQLAFETEQKGVQPIVILIATDERIFKFRHPLPSGKRFDRYAMLVLCGRRAGLVCSLTRLVHFGKMPTDLRRKAQAVAKVDATFIAHTRPGKTLNQVLQAGINAYTKAGFADEWKLHHQGGVAGYEPREYLATPTSQEMVSLGQVYAWNPSIAGTKSEDTILIAEQANQVLTFIEGWPSIEIEVDGQVFNRPAVLEIR